MGFDVVEVIVCFIFESEVGNVIKELCSVLGEFFVSVWVEDGKVINVVIFNEVDIVKVEKVGVMYKVVKIDFLKFQKVKKVLDDLLKQFWVSSNSELGIVLYYVDVVMNKFIIDVFFQSVDEVEVLVKDVGFLEFEFEVCQVDELLKLVIFFGGGGYVINRVVVCFVGFNVWGGFVLVGYCGRVGDFVIYLDGILVGIFQRFDFFSLDMSYISIFFLVQGLGYVGVYGI